MWDYTHDWKIPLEPKFRLRCPVCGGTGRFKEYFPHMREYKVHGRQPRVDQWYKCTKCSYVWVHGIHVTEEYYNEVTSKLQEIVGQIRPLHILEALDLEAEGGKEKT